MILNKKHNQQCNNTKCIYQGKKIIKIFPFFSELAKFSCQYANRWNKKDYQKCKELNVRKNLINTTFVKQ